MAGSNRRITVAALAPAVLLTATAGFAVAGVPTFIKVNTHRWGQPACPSVRAARRGRGA
jgi:hypothetical protein